jgi:ADP-ribose pyrophosphatase YjhB (NUDIX family)
MKHINVRVYGILIQDNQVLVSDEYIKGNNITKFPGGGLEYGEGTKECLMREFKEELNLNIEIVSHFYTTDFFVNSAFSNQSQIISVYYLVKPLGELDFSISTTVFDFNEVKEGAQSMRWIEIDKVSENDFTFIIDKHVADLLEK